MDQSQPLRVGGPVVRLRVWFVPPALVGLCLVCCTPDFDALSRGSGNLNSGGDLGSAGLSSSAGTGGMDSAAGASAGSGSHADNGGSAQTFGGTAGSLPNAGSPSAGSPSAGSPANGGSGTGGSSNGGSGSGPEGGAAGDVSCPFSAPSSVYMGFEAGSEKGFTQISYDAGADTTRGTTVSASIASTEGASCAGAFELTANFKGYGTDSSVETATGTMYFARSPWTNAVALHAMVKVASENSADATFRHLSGVQAFVMSGNYLYVSQFDAGTFRNGQWNEMVVSLKASAWFDPTSVFRLGVQGLVVSTADGTAPAGAPAVPPTTHFYLDDVWVEFL